MPDCWLLSESYPHGSRVCHHAAATGGLSAPTRTRHPRYGHTVYAALDPTTDELVTIKVLHPQLTGNPRILARFKGKAEKAARIDSPHVVRVLETGQASNTPYIVLKHVRGSTLRDYLDTRGALPVAEVIDLGRQLATGLAAAHAQGVIHRDIKPHNLMLSGGVVKIMDFGIARDVDATSATSTQVFSPHYAYPERVQDEPLDARTDLSSLGVVFYQLLTGEVPCDGRTPIAIAHKHLSEPASPIQGLRLEIPDDLAGIVERLLAKDPAARYQSAQGTDDRARWSHLLLYRLFCPQRLLDCCGCESSG